MRRINAQLTDRERARRAVVEATMASYRAAAYGTDDEYAAALQAREGAVRAFAEIRRHS